MSELQSNIIDKNILSKEQVVLIKIAETVEYGIKHRGVNIYDELVSLIKEWRTCETMREKQKDNYG